MGLQCYTTTEPITTTLPLTPARLFEDDIYKPLVWQQGEAWLLHLPDLSCVTMHKASCADKSDSVRAERASAEQVQGRA